MTNCIQVLTRTRKQFVADIGDDLFGQDVVNTIQTFRLLGKHYWQKTHIKYRLIYNLIKNLFFST